MSRDVGLQRQPGSPYWYADYDVWDAARGRWKRRFESTKCVAKSAAWPVAVALHKAATAAYQGALTGWSRDRAVEVLNDILKSADLPLFRLTMSWFEYSALWLQVQEACEVDGQGLKQGTVKVYRRCIKRFTAWLGKQRSAFGIDTIEGHELQSFYRDIRVKGLGVTTAKSTVDILSSVFERAKEEGYCSRNPASLVRMDTDLSNKVVKEPFTVGEVQKLIVEARKMPEYAEEWETLILLAVCIGARLGDCARLGIAHLDCTRKVWLLIFRPKKNERRGTIVEVPIVEPLYGRLAYLQMIGESLLFCPHLAQLNHLSGTFGRMMERAGIKSKVYVNPVTGRKIRSKSFHSFRHTLPSWLKSAGVDEETRMRIVGHASKEIHRGYTHVDLDAMAGALKKGLGKLAA